MQTPRTRTHGRKVLNGISLAGSQPGVHKVKGEIGVKERGQLAWKPWEFSYTVGQPMGVVAQPEMRIFYWGYANQIEGTASGFPADKISLTGNGCRLESKRKWQIYCSC
jgi:hypothetical protein